MSSRNGFLRLLLLLLLFNFCCQTYGLTCSSTQLTCRTVDKCVSIGYICDGDDDCGDRSDEAFCTEWRNTGCSSRNEANCMRHGSSSCVSMIDYCTASNPPCTGIVDPRICQMLHDGKLQYLSNVVLSTTEAPTTTTSIPTTTTPPPPVATNLDKTIIQGQMFVDSLNSTMNHPDCPRLFTRVGQHCFSLFYILKIGWGEAEKFCETIGGELVSFGNNPEMIDVMKHMRESGQTNDFWTGGRYVNETEGWQWLSGDNSMEGSPFWAVRYTNFCQEREGETGDLATAYWSNKTACYHYQQAPRPNTTDLCAAVTFRHYYYITDEDCLSPKSPLCKSTQSSSSSSSSSSPNVQFIQ